jgi:hypothetical protein
MRVFEGGTDIGVAEMVFDTFYRDSSLAKLRSETMSGYIVESEIVEGSRFFPYPLPDPPQLIGRVRLAILWVGEQDRFTPGISLSNSEVGLASLSIAAFFLRLVCTNGMISKTEVSASYRHISLKILDKFPEVLERVSYELGQQKSQFRISLQTPVENPLMTIESFNRQFQIGEKEREAVKWGWEQEPGKTMFHAVNAYTRAAEFGGLSAEASYRLQKVGGMVLGMGK